MDRLDDDTVQEILLRLPIRSLMQCRSVCRRIRDLTQGPYFTLLHTARSMVETPGITLNSMVADGDSSLHSHFLFVDRRMSGPIRPPCFPLEFSISDFSELYLMSSCNGLLLLVARAQDFTMFVGNPFLRNFIQLPNHQHPTGHHNSMHLDFGFCPKTQSYKVFEISNWIVDCGELKLEHQTTIHVHKLGEDSWKRIDQKMNVVIRKSGSASNINGALHWVDESSATTITIFDLEHDEFKEMPGPESDIGTFSTGTIGNSLSIFRVHQYVLEIWIMKEYWVSWEPYIIVNLSPILYITLEFQVFSNQIEDGRVLIFHNDRVLAYIIEEDVFQAILKVGGSVHMLIQFDTLVLPLQ